MKPTRGPRWKRLDPDARREQILECAIRLFGERPYSDVSTSDIVREAGVTRGLLNHYFGLKRDLYLEVVRRMVLLPSVDEVVKPTGSIEERVRASVKWYVDTVGAHGKTFIAVTGSGGIGDDPEVEHILGKADDVAATKVLQLVGLSQKRGSRADAQGRAVIRAYGGMVKAAMKEWVRNHALTKEQVERLLTQVLLCTVREVIPSLDRPLKSRRSRRA